MNQCEKLDRRPFQTPNAKTVEKTINFWSEIANNGLRPPFPLLSMLTDAFFGLNFTVGYV